MPVKNRIFLAHAREDKPQVRSLYAKLKEAGFDPWLDEIDLLPGQLWKDEIPKAIRDAGVFLACLSERSVSKVGYVQSEFRRALSAFGERPAGSIYLIPVRLDDCEVPDLQIPDLGISLKDVQWVDLFEEGGLDRLTLAIGQTLEGEQPLPHSDPTTISHFLRNKLWPMPKEAKPKSYPVEQRIDEEKETQGRKPKSKGLFRWRNVIIGLIAIIVIPIFDWGRLINYFLIGNPKEFIASSDVTSKVSEVGEVFRDCADCPDLVVIPAGSFQMGSPGDEAERFDNEGPMHEVSVPRFAIGRYEVTFAEWDACYLDGGCEQNPTDRGWFWSDRPVIGVSWEDAKEYVSWLSEKTGETYRLPSEAEWEYAARAGTTTWFAFGDEITKGQATFGRSFWKTTEVGSYPANAWGLHDMHGNVWEWVEDCWNEDYQGAPTDGSAWLQGDCSLRVDRGGAWFNIPVDLRSANRAMGLRGDRVYYIGFRVARTLTP